MAASSALGSRPRSRRLAVLLVALALALVRLHHACFQTVGNAGRALTSRRQASHSQAANRKKASAEDWLNYQGDDWKFYHLSPSEQRSLYSKFVKGFIASESGLRGWCQEIEAGGIKTTRRTLGKLLDVAAKKGSAREAESWFEIFSEYHQPDCYAYSSMIKAYAKAKRAKGALGWLDRAKADGIEPDPIMIAMAMDAEANAGNAKGAAKLLTESEAEGKMMNMKAYNVVIKAFLKKNDWDEAIEWLKLAEAKGLTADKKQMSVAYSTMISATAQAGEAEKAQAWVEKAKADGCPLEKEAFSSLIAAAMKKGDTMVAESLLEQMRDSRISPNNYAYTRLVNGFAKLGDVEKVELWVAKAEDDGILRDARMISSLVEAYAKAGNFERARAIVDATDDALVSDAYGALILAYANDAAVDNSLDILEMAAALIDEAKKRQVQVSITMYSAIIRGYARQRDRAKAEEWFHRAVSDGLTPDAWTYSSVIAAQTGSGDLDLSVRWLDEMAEANVTPLLSTYRIILRQCQEINQPGDTPKVPGIEAYKLFARMLKEGLWPDKDIYVELLQAFSMSDKMQRPAEFIFDHMHQVPGNIQADEWCQNRFIEIIGERKFRKICEEKGTQVTAGTAVASLVEGSDKHAMKGDRASGSPGIPQEDALRFPRIPVDSSAAFLTVGIPCKDS